MATVESRYNIIEEGFVVVRFDKENEYLTDTLSVAVLTSIIDFIFLLTQQAVRRACKISCYPT